MNLVRKIVNERILTILNFVDVLLTFIKKDFKIAVSYKTSFMINLLNAFFSVLSWAFLGNSIGYQKGLNEYNVSPVEFILSGMALSMLVHQTKITAGFLTPKNFEEVLTNPLPLWKQAILNNAWGFIWEFTIFTMYWLIGIFFFNIQFNVNILTLVTVIILALTLNLSFGLLHSGILLITKGTDPIDWFLITLSSLLSGQWFPYQSLPLWLQTISYFLPQTYILHIWRLAIFSNTPLNNVLPDLCILLSMTFITLCGGYSIWSYGIKKCKIEGVIL